MTKTLASLTLGIRWQIIDRYRAVEKKIVAIFFIFINRQSYWISQKGFNIGVAIV